MKKLTLALAAILTLMTSCRTSAQSRFGGKTIKESKNYVTKQIKVDDFDAISVLGSMDVTYIQKTGKPSVEVYGSDNIVEALDIRVKGNELVIAFKKNLSVSYNKLDIRVSSEKLQDARVGGSGSIYLHSGLKTGNLNIQVNGSGDIDGQSIECRDLKVTIAGSGDIELGNVTCRNVESQVAGSGDLVIKDVKAESATASIAGSGTLELNGETKEALYTVAGSGDIHAKDLKAQNVSAEIAGSGDIECHATDNLKVRTAGSGSVGYKGDPKLDVPKRGYHKL